MQTGLETLLSLATLHIIFKHRSFCEIFVNKVLLMWSWQQCRDNGVESFTGCFYDFIVVAQLLCCVWLCDLMDYSTPGSSVLHYLLDLLRFTCAELVMLSSHLILCHPLLPFAFNLSQHPRIFSNEMALHIRWPKY